MSPVASLARELVRIPSVNPEGDPGAAPTGEAAMAAFLGQWLEAHGAEVRIEDVLPGRPNVVARFPSSSPGKPRLLLAPHTDTVGVAGMTVPAFDGLIRDGRLYGRGACDTKGPMAAMLAAIEAIGSGIADLPWEIWFAGLMGEETRQQGSQALAARGAFDFVIVGEPTELAIVWAHKGSHRWRVEFSGRAAHSSRPEDGENAIEKAIEALAWLRREFSAAAAPCPILGAPTLSLGILRGGTRVNVVPDKCEAELDIRTVPGFDSGALLAAFRQAWPDAKIEDILAQPLRTDASHPLIQHLESLGAPRAVAPWFCDAAPFAARGMPAVALGPGSIAQAHTADESISIDDLETGAAFFEKFLRTLPSAAAAV